MPTYVYKNLKTGKVFELEQRITEAVLKKEPKTGDPVERVIQASGIVFKGGGFYKTDSRPTEKSGKSASKSDAASSKGDSGDSGSSGTDSAKSGSDTSSSSGADSSKVSNTEKPAKVASPAKSAAAKD
jgi:predicted nucleic acid-binding Zn ribbon protein